MIFLMFLILLLTAGIIFFTNPKSEQARWTALFMLCGSVGAFSYVITETIIPFFDQLGIKSTTLRSVLIHLRIQFNFITEIVTPYAVVMYSVVSSGLVQQKIKNILAYVLIVPIVVMYFITPFDPEKYQINFKIALLWLAPYYLFSCLLLIVAYLREKQWTRRHNRLITLFICIPSILSVLVFDNIAKMINPDTNLFRLVPVSIVYSFIIFIIFSYFFGALGVKMKFEQHVLDNTMKAISSGTSLLNHSIKNQIYKINSSLQIMKPYNSKLEPICIEAIDIIERSADHLMDMVDRIRSQTQEIVIQKNLMNLNQLLDEAVDHLRSELENRNVFVEKEYAARNVQIFCDGPHTKEVFINVLKNAMDAVEIGGKIRLHTSFGRFNEVTVKISDNGSGISPDNMKHITEPFFTTKGSRGTNFGLGLSYCYDVMMKSGGKLEFESEPNKGTTVKLTFSPKGG